ncbi:hypothetical protein [Limobrevibacterium gyesilva]|uniref:Lipoprotein n=1 Tax=Limobrevibacterium gyesilva TaxID=2991712 RepID=A0AA41YQQ0_9PROT|nr:hypothetical protein [Limobrevibacterium gyesilva]MCW3474878.1 hypothetical protein [Limobrevibacterium gyesilva]
MRLSIFAVLLPVCLGGCLSFTGTTPAKETVVVPPANTTTVVPAPATVVCSNGLRPPC